MHCVLYLIPSTLSYILVVSQMPVMGPTYCQIEGTAAKFLVVAGAPLGATDLEIAEKTLTTCGYTKDPDDGIFKKNPAGGGAPLAMER
jgi:hypothetical protein